MKTLKALGIVLGITAAVCALTAAVVALCFGVPGYFGWGQTGNLAMFAVVLLVFLTAIVRIGMAE